MTTTGARFICVLAGLFLLASRLHTAEPPRQGAAAALHALFAEAWEQDLRENPTMASRMGDRRYDRLWMDMSPAANARRDAADDGILRRLHAIDRGQLSAEDQLNYDLFERGYLGRQEIRPFKAGMYSIMTGGGGLHTLWDVTETLPFATVQDYESWIARLNALDVHIEQCTALLEEGIREKRVPPRILLDRVTGPLAALAGSPTGDNPFFEPFKRMPATIAPAEQARLAAEGRTAIERKVAPAYKRLNQFFLARYLKAGRQAVGIWSTPDGDAFYRERIASHTTTRMTADEIHDIGLKEVARIRGEMQQVIEQVNFTGTFAQFLRYLRTDPKFYYRTAEELFDAYLVTSKRIDPELVKLFGKLPRMPYGVRPIAMATAPNTTTAYYAGPAPDGSRPGYYYVNLHRPEVRPKYEIEALTVHEAVPGHHLQVALALEQPELPMFRRLGGLTAYVEGWGLYAESLGGELGLYKDPYSRFGQLTYEMWRAVRLVVDTGLHARRWTRQQAVDYFMANAAKTEADIINEVDRYISIPGQALAYKIGELKIKALRRAAEERLGAKFDIRAFHDTVLESGAVPLDILEQRIEAWMRTRLAQT